MSNWVHITGSARLHSRSTVTINKKEDFLKPDEQMYLKQFTERDPDSGYIVYESSLPVIKDIVSKSIDVLPAGENTHIEYNVYQSENMVSSSSSYFRCEAEEAQFRRLLYCQEAFLGEDYKDKLRWIKHIDYAALTILDDVRYANASTMMAGLTDFFSELWEKHVLVDHGYFEWEEDWIGDYTYAMKVESDQIACMILDVNTRNVVSKKLYKLTYNPDLKPIVLEDIEDPNWNDLMK